MSIANEKFDLEIKPNQTKHIPLIGGARTTLVDAEDFNNLGHWHWYAAETRGKVYVVRAIPRGRTKISLHREILNASPRQIIEHINGDGLDNRRANLRFCTQQENQFNRSKTKNPTTSRFKGVRFVTTSACKPWLVQIRIKGKVTHIGCFATEEAAAFAYDCAARKHFGEFSKLNFQEVGQ